MKGIKSFFTGVELLNPIPTVADLETKFVKLTRYASWKHIGPYYRLKEAYAAMKSELKAMEINYHYPLIEIYGHWNEDESKLETEILFSLE